MLKCFVVLAAVGCVSGFSTPTPSPTTSVTTTKSKTGYRIDGCRDLVSQVFQVDHCLPAWKTCCPGGNGLVDGKPAICSLSELNCKPNRTDDESCHGQWMRKNCANFCGLCVEDDECPWFDQDSGIDDLVICNDGTKCKDLADNEESCCRHHAGIATCPKNRKFMCNDGFSCSGNTEHCCVSDYTKCHFMGGVKTCKGEDDPRIPEEDQCTTPFNNANNFLKLATIFLAGPESPAVRSTESPSECAWECIFHGERCKSYSYFQQDNNGRGNCFLFYGTLTTDGYEQIKSDDATFYHRINFDCIIATTTTSTTTDTGSGDGNDFLDDDDLATTDTTSSTVSTTTASTKSTISTTTVTTSTTTTTSSVTSSSISSTTESTISSSTVSSSTKSTGTSTSVTTQTTTTNTSTRTTISVTVPTETTTTSMSDTPSSTSSTSTSSSTSSLLAPLPNSSSTTARRQSTSVTETTIEPEAETTTVSAASGNIPVDDSETTEIASTRAAKTESSSSKKVPDTTQDSTDVPITSKKSYSTTVVVSTLDDNEGEIFETAKAGSSSSNSTTYIAVISAAVIIVLIGLTLIIYRARKSRYEQPVTFSHPDVVDNGTITKAEFEAGVIPALQAAGKGDRETIKFRKAGGVQQTANNEYEFKYEFDDNSRSGEWAQRNGDAPPNRNVYGIGGYSSSDFPDTEAALRSHDESRTSVATGVPQRLVVSRSDVKEIDEFSGPEYDESDFGFGTVSTAIQGYTSPGRNSSTSPRKNVEVIDEISI